MSKIEPIYVKFEQAKKLKEKGFDENCRMLINGDYEPHHLNLTETFLQKNSEILESCYSVPEQWQVVEWLRVKHNIWINVNWFYIDEIIKWNATVDYIGVLSGFYYCGKYETPEEAYSEAFNYVLNNL